ncbi:hypothetical protein OEA41_005685 [Lepraria neglecta]|uniref:Uncharacterized protein n=1 Tax=Lepraria neglecta TaxID=209136 RepID=A0AAD9Z684_9LECA|nr:hypothetical protein OEA41_005685 [Lepraria neglecta]
MAGVPPSPMALMHPDLSLGPLRGPPSGLSCPPILAPICSLKANNIDGTLPPDDAIVATSDTVRDPNDPKNHPTQNPSESPDQKPQPSTTQNQEPSSSVSTSSMSNSASTLTSNSLSSQTSSEMTSSMSSSTVSSSSSSVSSSLAMATETTARYVIVGKPGADDTAINNYLQTVLDADQYKHVLYQLDETGKTGSKWFFGDELSGTDTFSYVHGINQSQADSIQKLSGVNYIFPDTVVEGLSTDRPGFDPNASIAAYTDPPATNDPPADKRSAPWMGTPHLVKRNPQVGYTRQVNGRDELKLLSNYYTADQLEEPEFN